jgi:hypothetical protein
MGLLSRSGSLASGLGPTERVIVTGTVAGTRSRFFDARPLQVVHPGLLSEAAGIAFPDYSGMLDHKDPVSMQKGKGHILLAQQDGNIGVLPLGIHCLGQSFQND